MSILDGAEFDQRIDTISELLQESLGAQRFSGLETVTEFLRDTFVAMGAEGLGEMTREALQSFVVQAIADLGLLASQDDATLIDALLTDAMRAIDKDARQASADVFGLDIDPTYPTDDTRLVASQQNNAGAFLLARDNQVAARIAGSIAELLADSNDEDIPEQLDAMTLLLDGAWGEQAEETYWILVAAAWLARARNAGTAAALQDAGIERARIVAELDERTTVLCQFLHGKVIEVSSAIANDSTGLAEPGKGSTWPSISMHVPLDAEPGAERTAHIYLPGDPPKLLAARDQDKVSDDLALDVGSYTQYMSDDDLAQTLGPPPYHFLCRSILVPEYWEDLLGVRADITYDTDEDTP